ncbi:MAG TPA: endonuclease/exonuclease/phosphatase family protein [Candidatus Binataceae bacterium]
MAASGILKKRDSAGEFAVRAPYDPIVVNRPARDRGGPFKLVSFNASGGRRIGPIIDCLSRPPLAGAAAIFLIEVDWKLPRSGNLEIAAEIAARLGMSCGFQPALAFAKSEDSPPHAYFGLAILSAVPLKSARAIPVPATYERTIGRFRGVPRRAFRIFAPAELSAAITWGGRSIHLGAVHLESHTNPAGRDLQVASLLSGFPSGPAILAGDFNTTTTELSYRSAVVEVIRRIVVEPRRFRDPARHEPLFERLRAAGFSFDGANVPLKPTFTFTRVVPPPMRPKLDWMCARGPRPIPGTAAVVLARRSILSPRFSDHDFIVCDFDL